MPRILWMTPDVDRPISGTLGGMEWTDLDQVYLEILDEHPAVTWTPCPPVRPF